MLGARPGVTIGRVAVGLSDLLFCDTSDGSANGLCSSPCPFGVLASHVPLPSSRARPLPLLDLDDPFPGEGDRVRSSSSGTSSSVLLPSAPARVGDSRFTEPFLCDDSELPRLLSVRMLSLLDTLAVVLVVLCRRDGFLSLGDVGPSVTNGVPLALRPNVKRRARLPPSGGPRKELRDVLAAFLLRFSAAAHLSRF